MIEQIQSKILPTLSYERIFPHPRPFEQSSLESMTSQNSYGRCFWSLLDWLVNLLKAFFCCPVKTPDSQSKKDPPKIFVKTLSPNDPFGKLLFKIKGGKYVKNGPHLVFKRGNLKKIKIGQTLEMTNAILLSNKVFKLLAESSWFSMLFVRSYIKKIDPILVQMDMNPLEYFVYIYMTKERAKNVVAFKNRFSFMRAWTQFVNRNAEAFKKKKREIPLYVPGFCKLMELSEAPIQKLVQQKKWKELIIHIFTEIKNKYSLN